MSESPHRSLNSPESNSEMPISRTSLNQESDYPHPSSIISDVKSGIERPEAFPKGDGRLLKVASAMDEKTIDAMDFFFRELWYDFKNFNILRLSIRLFVIFPVLILIWLFIVVQLFGLVSDFDIWVPIIEWFNSSSASNPGNFDPPIPESD